LETPSIGQLQSLLDSGEITVQDESAGMAVQLLSPEPGENILDACASPGGKTIAISRLMQGKGKLTAVDTTDERIALLNENIERTGLKNVTVVQADVREIRTGEFDRIICDVPCSSTGLLRKQPDIRWRRKSQHIAVQHHQQVEILDRASELLKPAECLSIPRAVSSPWKIRKSSVASSRLIPSFIKKMPAAFFPNRL